MVLNKRSVYARLRVGGLKTFLTQKDYKHKAIKQDKWNE